MGLVSRDRGERRKAIPRIGDGSQQKDRPQPPFYLWVKGAGEHQLLGTSLAEYSGLEEWVEWYALERFELA